jgi:dipeptidyl aminopeptidase/acylaminoacyl peptidase
MVLVAVTTFGMTAGCGSSRTISRAQEIGAVSDRGVESLPAGCRETPQNAPRGWLFQPASDERSLDKLRPAVVMLHKGFAYDRAAAAHATLLLGRAYASRLCGRGIAVMALDYRYSAVGGHEMDDVVAAFDQLAAVPSIDRNRIGLVGGSHGGYMTLLALAERRRPFASGAAFYTFGDVAAVFERGILHNPATRLTQRHLGDLVTHAAAYRRISPASQLDRVSVPLLLISGTDDEFAPDMRSLRDGLQAAGADFEFHEVSGGRHGFEVDQGRATEQLWQLATAFLERTLSPPT